MSQSDIQAGFERLLSHCSAPAPAVDADLNPHTPMSLPWYAHALEVTERQKHEAVVRLEESRRQVDALREENRQLRMQIEVGR